MLRFDVGISNKSENTFVLSTIKLFSRLPDAEMAWKVRMASNPILYQLESRSGLRPKRNWWVLQ